MKVLYFIILIFTLPLVFCKREGASVEQNPPKLNDIMDDNTRAPLWNIGCIHKDFSHFFDCNTLDCYQLELLNDPFKDMIIISIYIKDSITDIVYYNRFRVRQSMSKNIATKTKLSKLIPIVNQITKDTLYCYYGATKKIVTKKIKKLNSYFIDSIKGIPEQDSLTDQIDGEIWRVKSRFNGSNILVTRRNFTDSLYYKNIQNILTICGIKDYKYTGNK